MLPDSYLGLWFNNVDSSRVHGTICSLMFSKKNPTQIRSHTCGFYLLHWWLLKNYEYFVSVYSFIRKGSLQSQTNLDINQLKKEKSMFLFLTPLTKCRHLSKLAELSFNWAQQWTANSCVLFCYISLIYSVQDRVRDRVPDCLVFPQRLIVVRQYTAH